MYVTLALSGAVVLALLIFYVAMARAAHRSGNARIASVDAGSGWFGQVLTYGVANDGTVAKTRGSTANGATSDAVKKSGKLTKK